MGHLGRVTCGHVRVSRLTIRQSAVEESRDVRTSGDVEQGMTAPLLAFLIVSSLLILALAAWAVRRYRRESAPVQRRMLLAGAIAVVIAVIGIVARRLL
jgi:uncharacterized membrane protein YidH (DUF202 family)